jgi:DNA-binding transcriptional LysR family regulator
MEDKALLERLSRKAVPLDAGAEFHSRADRITLEMRRILRELVDRAAVAS